MGWTTWYLIAMRMPRSIRAPAFDAFVTTCSDELFWCERDDIGTCALTQWASATADLAHPQPAAECELVASFVGSNYGDRSARIESLRRAGIAAECFGHGWPIGPVDAARLRAIVRDSRLSLNFSEAGAGSRRKIKAWVFEVPAAGGMLLTESAPHLERYLKPGREIATFDDDTSLLSWVRRLLDNPQERDAMENAGHARVVRVHTYEVRRAGLLTEVVPAANGTLGPVDWQCFTALAGRHHLGVMLRALRDVLSGLATLALGEARWTRAARRQLFEISRRLAGRHTYTAADRPWRLFYRES